MSSSTQFPHVQSLQTMKDRDVPLAEPDTSVLAEVALSRSAIISRDTAMYLDRLGRLAAKPAYDNQEETSIDAEVLVKSKNALRYLSDAYKFNEQVTVNRILARRAESQHSYTTFEWPEKLVHLQRFWNRVRWLYSSLPSGRANGLNPEAYLVSRRVCFMPKVGIKSWKYQSDADAFRRNERKAAKTEGRAPRKPVQLLRGCRHPLCPFCYSRRVLRAYNKINKTRGAHHLSKTGVPQVFTSFQTYDVGTEMDPNQLREHQKKVVDGFRKKWHKQFQKAHARAFVVSRFIAGNPENWLDTRQGKLFNYHFQIGVVTWFEANPSVPGIPKNPHPVTRRKITTLSDIYERNGPDCLRGVLESLSPILEYEHMYSDSVLSGAVLRRFASVRDLKLLTPKFMTWESEGGAMWGLRPATR